MKIVKKKLKDGRIKEYRYPRKAAANSVGDVIRQYLKSPGWNELKPNSRRSYRQGLDYFADLRDVYIGDIRRRHILDIRDSLSDTPAMANIFLRVTSVLFNFAVDREIIEFSPVANIKKLKTGEWRRWRDDEINLLFTEGSDKAQLAALMAIYTGQRSGDLINMLWSDYDGQTIKVVQEKTGEPMQIPVHPELKAELDKTPKTAMTILTGERGERMTISYFRKWWWLNTKKPLGLECQFHGLRKNAASYLAEAGCTLKQIAAITGHQSLSMLELYTREAEQFRNAQAAVVKLSTKTIRKPLKDM